jgi:hypothetical protein
MEYPALDATCHGDQCKRLLVVADSKIAALQLPLPRGAISGASGLALSSGIFARDMGCKKGTLLRRLIGQTSLI